MITQVIWADVNNRELGTVYARSGDEEIREIQFIICKNDPPEKVEIPVGVSGQFRMIKTSGNFVVRDMVKTVLENGTVIFTVSVSDQMVNVHGTGYYDIRLSGGGYLYTASGQFIVDTPVISSSVLEDVSEVNGLVFPDDFLTTKDHVAQIDDSIISSSSVWSSYKTNSEIGNQIEEAIEDLPSPMTNYSTTPVQVGTWLNGITPVYEKVILSDFGEYVTSKNIPFSSSNDQYIIDFRVFIKPSDADDGLIPAFPSLGYSGTVEAGDGGSLYGTTGVTITRSGGTAYGVNPQIIIIYRYYPKEGD